MSVASGRKKKAWEKIESTDRKLVGEEKIPEKEIDDPVLMTNPLRDARPEDRPPGLDYPDPRLVARNGHQQHQGNSVHQIGGPRIRRTRASSLRRRMHLANEVPPQGSAAGNNLSDYALTADLLAERTLDGLFAEHPGELIRTGKRSCVLGFVYHFILKEFKYSTTPFEFRTKESLLNGKRVKRISPFLSDSY